MRWTSLEEWRRRFAVSHHLQLPALLDRAHALLRSAAHHLHYDEGEQNEPDMANHRLIYPALARLQARILLAVSKERLYLPTAHLALGYRGEIRPQVVGDDVLVVAMTVSGHDQPQGAVLGSVDAHGCGAYPETLSPLQRQRPGQLAHRAPLAAPQRTIVLGWSVPTHTSPSLATILVNHPALDSGCRRLCIRGAAPSPQPP